MKLREWEDKSIVLIEAHDCETERCREARGCLGDSLWALVRCDDSSFTQTKQAIILIEEMRNVEDE